MEFTQGYYKFIFVNNSLFINTDINILKLFYYLFRFGRPFEFLTRNTRFKTLNCFPNIVRSIRILEFVMCYGKMRISYKSGKTKEHIIKKSNHGHCLISLRTGEFKIFNFSDSIVTTLFPTHTPPSDIESAVKKIHLSSRCARAPKLINHCIQSGIIKEEYINLNRPSYTLGDKTKFVKQVIPLLERIAQIDLPTKISARNYRLQLKKTISTALKYVEEERIYNQNQIDKLKTCFNKIYESLESVASNQVIVMGYSHGDLWNGNLLGTDDNLYAIDWTTLDKRSFYFDLFFILFSQASRSNKQNIIPDLISKMNYSISHYPIYKTDSPIENNQPSNVFSNYRYFFYMELLTLKLSESPNNTTNHIKELLRWINMFEDFESALCVQENRKINLRGEKNENPNHRRSRIHRHSHLRGTPERRT
ncbi:hypothetical protein CR205_14915 [Alteribacter lacisalsi]|uniref:Aminoglycoside phosphotransferase domain-containing protein n=1 Tax=Alteribacter lacisalsi TaxID=2045244 RepID=A0A2W0HJ03_9BACI|nr:hypothetical protein [Alteribacter lacisalsi]PYZ96962.1 hypothetical protein CR205_14915 [Alteribacter lacisalsi]